MHYNQKVIDKYKNAPVLNTASKVALFSLHQYHKLVYIDSDTIVLQNIDELFRYPDGSMIYFPADRCGFTGLMVFTPKNHKFDYYRLIMDNYECSDGNLFGDLWFYVKSNVSYQISPCYLMPYDAILDEYDKNIDITKRKEYKVVHFVNNPKPWLAIDQFKDDIWCMHYYKTLYTDLKKRYGV